MLYPVGQNQVGANKPKTMKPGEVELDTSGNIYILKTFSINNFSCFSDEHSL